MKIGIGDEIKVKDGFKVNVSVTKEFDDGAITSDLWLTPSQAIKLARQLENIAHRIRRRGRVTPRIFTPF